MLLMIKCFKCNSENEKAVEDLNMYALMCDAEHRKEDAASWINCHKRSMHTIDQEHVRTVVVRHFIAEISAQLKVHQKKGTVIDRFDAVSLIMFEALEH